MHSINHRGLTKKIIRNKQLSICLNALTFLDESRDLAWLWLHTFFFNIRGKGTDDAALHFFFLTRLLDKLLFVWSPALASNYKKIRASQTYLYRKNTIDYI